MNLGRNHQVMNRHIHMYSELNGDKKHDVFLSNVFQTMRPPPLWGVTTISFFIGIECCKC